MCIPLFFLYARYRAEPALQLQRHAPFFASVRSMRLYLLYVTQFVHLVQLGFCLAGYVLNLLPYLAVVRSCFIYHYMPALMCALACLPWLCLSYLLLCPLQVRRADRCLNR
jgi:dolichyl-phosphate-mannose--protein O-mannosyl transferase